MITREAWYREADLDRQFSELLNSGRPEDLVEGLRLALRVGRWSFLFPFYEASIQYLAGVLRGIGGIKVETHPPGYGPDVPHLTIERGVYLFIFVTQLEASQQATEPQYELFGITDIRRHGGAFSKVYGLRVGEAYSAGKIAGTM